LEAKMRVRLAVIGVVVVVALGATTHVHAQDDVAGRFVGMWRLASWQQRLADGTVRQPANSVAYIIYTDTGHMCYVAMNPNRPKWASERAPTPEEALSGITGFGSYCARVEVHAKEGFVLHHVEIEKTPNIVGRTRKRWFTFEGPDRVSLRVDRAELAPGIAESTLTWQRVGK
jgi:hypothetical protein